MMGCIMGAVLYRVGLVVFFLVLATPASAEEIVIESYGGDRPADADALMQPVLSELRGRGYLVGEALARRIDRRYASPGVELDAESIARARRFIDSGYDQFLNGNWELAIQETQRGLGILQQAPAQMARQQDIRDLLFAGLVHLAGAHHNTGAGEDATRVMAELLRTFPDREISRAKYAPNIWQLWRQVREDLRQRGVGSLRVNVDDSRTVVFIDERYSGLGTVSAADLYPGLYRVYVQQGERSGRVHEIEVDAGAEAVLPISWGLDAALRTAGSYAGLEHADEQARGTGESRLGIKLTRAVGGTGLIVLGIRDINERRSIVGTVLSLETGKPIRSAAVAVEPVEPSPEKLRALGRFLAGETVTAEFLQPIDGGGASSNPSGPDDRAASGPRPFKTWKWVTLLSGLGALGGGITLIAIDNPPVDGVRTPDNRETMVAGLFTAGAGAVLTGVGIYMFVKDGQHKRRRTVVSAGPMGSVGDGWGISLSGRF